LFLKNCCQITVECSVFILTLAVLMRQRNGRRRTEYSSHEPDTPLITF